MTTVKVPKAENFVDRIAAALERHAVDPDETDNWRIVRAGETAPLKGDHGSWVETDHPAVVAIMGSVPQCAQNGCQLNWRLIETAPQDGRWMLLQGLARKTDGYWTLPAIAGWSKSGNCWRSMDGAVVGATHWMPLPDPPAMHREQEK